MAWRIVPFLIVLYLFAYLGRVNISFASLQMNADLGFSGAIYGIGAKLLEAFFNPGVLTLAGILFCIVFGITGVRSFCPRSAGLQSVLHWSTQTIGETYEIISDTGHGAGVPRNLVAYSGPYTSEGPGKVSYHVDITITPAQKGTDTGRTYLWWETNPP